MEVDAVAAANFLATRYDDASTPVALARGAWSQAFAFTSGDSELVIRFGQHVEDYEKDRAAAAFDSPELPVPEVVEIGEAFDGVYAISTRMFGRFLDELDPVEFRRVLPSLFSALDAIRELTPPGEGYGMWGPDGTAPLSSWRDYLLAVADDRPRISGWRPLLASRPGAERRFDEGYRALERLVADCPEVRHLVHTDLMGGNVLVDDDRITGVFDWGNAVYGDFVHDLAHIAFWMPWFPELESVDFPAEAAAHFAASGVQIPGFEERMRCYMVHIGLDAQTYNALTERWDELERSARRTLEVAGSG